MGGEEESRGEQTLGVGRYVQAWNKLEAHKRTQKKMSEHAAGELGCKKGHTHVWLTWDAHAHKHTHTHSAHMPTTHSHAHTRFPPLPHSPGAGAAHSAASAAACGPGMPLASTARGGTACWCCGCSGGAQLCATPSWWHGTRA